MVASGATEDQNLYEAWMALRATLDCENKRWLFC